MFRRFRLSLMVLFLGAAVSGPLRAADSTGLEHLVECMTGHFTNTAQARGDHTFHDTTLHVARVWLDRTDGPWLYVEQALTDVPDHPFRQLVYQLRARDDDRFEARVFEPVNPLPLTSGWRDKSVFEKISPADLRALTGCTLVLQAGSDGVYKGGTEGHACTSAIPGAAYSTIVVAASENETDFWERGFNARDAQVWGSTHGGQEFKRVE